MDRNYLLKVIEKNFFVLDKDELSREIADNPFLRSKFEKPCRGTKYQFKR